MKKNAIIAMSGGVDSSVAAALMLEHGFHCAGITFELFQGKSSSNFSCSNASCSTPIEDARSVAFNLGMEHFVINLTEEFDKQVVQRFVKIYEQGDTPNPCIDCNRRIKFNMGLFRTPGLPQFDYLATGHYARVKYDEVSGRYLLQKALDNKKDQSYVLYSLSQQQLEKIKFPLGELSKDEVRKIAEEKKLASANKKESQDICFVPDGDYSNFIEEYTGKKYPCGDIIDTEGKKIGRHQGIIRYTIGQRRGLGVAANIPVYVTAKSAADNTVTLGPEDALYSKSLTAKDINLIACADLKKAMRVMVKTRYLQEAQSAVAEQTGENILYIEFDKPQRAITPGQAAVLYDGDIVVGGGTIS